MQNRWLHWFAAPAIAIGGWQAYLNKDTIMNSLPSFCNCEKAPVVAAGPITNSPPPVVEPVKPEPAPAPKDEPKPEPPKPAPVVEPPKPVDNVAAQPTVVVNCPTAVQSRRDEDALTEILKFVVGVTDDAVATNNPDLAKCAIQTLVRLSGNDKLFKLPKQRLQDVHTQALYSLRRLQHHVKDDQSRVLTPWLMRIERQMVTAIDKPQASQCK